MNYERPSSILEVDTGEMKTDKKKFLMLKQITMAKLAR